MADGGVVIASFERFIPLVLCVNESIPSQQKMRPFLSLAMLSWGCSCPLLSELHTSTNMSKPTSGSAAHHVS